MHPSWGQQIQGLCPHIKLFHDNSSVLYLSYTILQGIPATIGKEEGKHTHALLPYLSMPLLSFEFLHFSLHTCHPFLIYLYCSLLNWVC